MNGEHCGGAVLTLEGQLVLTGKAYIGGKHIERKLLERRIRAQGGRVLQDGTRNRQVTLLDQGDLSAGRVADPVNVRSKKLAGLGLFVYLT